MVKSDIRKMKRLFGSRSSSSSAIDQQTEQKLIDETTMDLSDPPLTPLDLHGYSPSTRNRLLNRELGEEIRGLLPARLQIAADWQLLYSMEQHGASLSTLYRLVKPERTQYDRNGYVLVVKDRKGGVFGAFVNEFFHPTDKHRFYGNGECFLWKCKYVDNDDEEEDKECDRILQFKGFPYTGLNDYIIYCTSDILSLGVGGGRYGLWLDRDLIKGVSDRSLTFGNEALSEEGIKFGIIGVEVWRVG